VRRCVFLLSLLLWSLAVAAQNQPEPAAGVTIHIVQRGESLWRIARYYGVTVEQLALLNGLPPTSGIFAGQRLLVPDQSAVNETPNVSPPPVESFHVVARGETLFRIAHRKRAGQREQHSGSIFDLCWPTFTDTLSRWQHN
jgi:Tfp pilus assembly protein FimV